MTCVTKRSFLKLSLALAASASASAITADLARAADVKKVLLIINGNLGDKSFFDSAARGMDMIKKKYGDQVETRVLEISEDQAKWEPALLDASEQDWDLIIVGTFAIAEVFAGVAKQYPDKKYIIYDATVPYAEGDYGNVYSIQYKQNEGSYLGGVLAAGLLKSGALPADVGRSLGFLGGMDVPVINDFLVGYIAGAQSVNPDIKVAVSYVGSFFDAAKGKELGLAQYRSGVGIGFIAAAQAGLGMLSAAKETNKYVLGVDSDQEAIFAESDPAIASKLVSSVLKNVDVSLLQAYDRFVAGTLPFGKGEALGMVEGAVGIVEHGNMKKLAKPDVVAAIEEAKKKIVSGEIKVPTAFGISTEEIAKIRDGVRP